MWGVTGLCVSASESMCLWVWLLCFCRGLVVPAAPHWVVMVTAAPSRLPLVRPQGVPEAVLLPVPGEAPRRHRGPLCAKCVSAAPALARFLRATTLLPRLVILSARRDEERGSTKTDGGHPCRPRRLPLQAGQSAGSIPSIRRRCCLWGRHQQDAATSYFLILTAAAGGRVEAAVALLLRPSFGLGGGGAPLVAPRRRAEDIIHAGRSIMRLRCDASGGAAVARVRLRAVRGLRGLICGHSVPTENIARQSVAPRTAGPPHLCCHHLSAAAAPPHATNAL